MQLNRGPLTIRFREESIRPFLDSISPNSLRDIRDKAIFSVLLYSWCRVSALINLTVADYYERGGTRWLRFQEKRGKEHEVPVHSKAKEAVDLWLERSHLTSNPSAFIFPSFAKNLETIESRRLDRRSVLKLVEKRAKANGILKRVCCHSFRATGVTEYMNSGGTIEITQRIAGHTSPATTRIYDRSGDRLTLEEIERVQIGKKRKKKRDLSFAPRAFPRQEVGFYARKCTRLKLPKQFARHISCNRQLIPPLLSLRLGVRSREDGYHGLLRSSASIDPPLADGCVATEAKLGSGDWQFRNL